MIKVQFKPTQVEPIFSLEVYDTINRVPFSLKIGSTTNRPTSIYCETSSGNNFIEFWFSEETQKLYEITLVTLQNDKVTNANDIMYDKEGSNYFDCIFEKETKASVSDDIEINRYENGVSINWNKDESDLNYYSISRNCTLGVDSVSFITSISLTSLDKEAIIKIFGF